jgi:L-alanine-DL-glutamate epimerase-like enolase superfamily enzyme
LIASVKARLLAASPERGVEFGIGHYDTYSMVLVEVADDEGRVGYGEAIARRGGEMTVAAVESLLAPIVVGGEPREVEGHWVAMIDQLRRWGHSGGVVVEALSGVDAAIWDLLGKQEEKPVWELLHGAGRERVPVYASSVYIADVAAMEAEALELVERGFRTVKVKIGRSRDESGLAADVEALAAIREAVGPTIGVVVDANGEYDAATAIRIGRELEALDIGWFEEPVPPDDLEGYARIRQVSKVPLARGETDFSLFGFRELISRRLIDVVQPDLGRCGGVTGARHVYTLAYASNVDFAPHTGFSGGLSQLAAIHVGAAAPALRAVEYMIIDNPVREIFVGGFPRPEGGEIAVPQGPGFGLELDHDLVDEYARSRPSD